MAATVVAATVVAAELIAPHAAARAIHAAMSRAIGMTAGAVALRADAGVPAVRRAAAHGMILAAVVAAHPTALVTVRCEVVAHQRATTGMVPHAGAAALATLARHVVRRAADSGATKTLAHADAQAWALEGCAIPAWRAAGVSQSRRKAASRSPEDLASSSACLC